MLQFIERQKRRFARAPLANKILVIVALSSLLSISLISIANIVRDFDTYDKREVDRLEAMANILANNSVASLRFNDPDTAVESLQTLQSERAITCAVIFNNSGEVFADYHRDQKCEIPEFPIKIGASEQKNAYYFTKAVELSGRRLGTLLLRSDRRDFWSNMFTSLGINFVVLIVAFTLSFLLARKLLPLITDPVEELVNLASRVSAERNYSLRARKISDDEIGMLVDSINFMLASIRQRDEAIKETNRNLEKLVADRTAKLVEARENAEQALESKAEFVATMSHELRTPMNAIIGMSSVLQYDGLDEGKRRQIEIIQKSAVNLLDLINDILDFSKIEANRLELEKAPFDLVSCIEEAMDITAASKKHNRLIYGTHIDPKLPTHVLGDVTRVRQILVNLLSNAFKFTKQGSVTLDAILISGETEEDDRIQISVRDTGIGIEEDRLTSVFESFTQANRSTSREYGGSGLGLTISYRLAQTMGGDIHVESELGTGSVFQLTLPIRRAESFDSLVGRPLDVDVTPSIVLKNLPSAIDVSLRSTLTSWGCRILGANETKHTKPDITIVSAICDDEFNAVEKVTRQENNKQTAYVCHPDHATLLRKSTQSTVLTIPLRNRDLRNFLLRHTSTTEAPIYDASTPFGEYNTQEWLDLKILLAEDNELSRNVFIHHMELIGLEIDTANNGVQATEKAIKNGYDLIFMDVRMPLRDGLSASKKIRHALKAKDVPWIVGFTANTEPDALQEIERAGMNDYLAKPALIGNIAEAINRYVFHRSARKEEA